MTTYVGKLVLDPALGVTVPKNSGGGDYEAYILKYSTPQGRVQDLIKPMASLKYKPSILKTLQELKKGDDITITVEKNDKGFNDVQAIQKGIQDLPPGEQESTQTASRPTGKVLGSTYETPEERKVKQRLIVRQATLNAAIELGGTKQKLEDVLVNAEQLETWVYRGME